MLQAEKKVSINNNDEETPLTETVRDFLDPGDFYSLLKSRGLDFYTGVPDSLLKDFCAYVSDNAPSDHHVITANEVCQFESVFSESDLIADPLYVVGGFDRFGNRLPSGHQALPDCVHAKLGLWKFGEPAALSCRPESILHSYAYACWLAWGAWKEGRAPASGAG